MFLLQSIDGNRVGWRVGSGNNNDDRLRRNVAGRSCRFVEQNGETTIENRCERFNSRRGPFTAIFSRIIDYGRLTRVSCAACQRPPLLISSNSKLTASSSVLGKRPQRSARILRHAPLLHNSAHCEIHFATRGPWNILLNKPMVGNQWRYNVTQMKNFVSLSTETNLKKGAERSYS